MVGLLVLLLVLVSRAVGIEAAVATDDAAVSVLHPLSGTTIILSLPPPREMPRTSVISITGKGGRRDVPTTDCCCCREDDEDIDADIDDDARDDSSQAERFRFDRGIWADEVRLLCLVGGRGCC